MAGERQKGARIGEHAHEAGKQPQVGKCLELFLHPVALVEMPPPGSELHLARNVALKVSEHRGHRKIIRRVVVVNDGFGKRILRVQTVQEMAHPFGLRPISDRVGSRIRSEGLDQSARIVT